MNDKIDPSPAQPALQGGGVQGGGATATQPNRAVRGVAYALVLLLALLGAWAAYRNFGPGTAPPTLTQAPPAPQPAAVAPAAPPVPPAEPAVAEAPKAEPAPGPAPETERKPARETDRTPAPERSWVSDGAGGKPASSSRRPAAEQTSAAVAASSAEPRPDTRAAGAAGAWFVQAGVYNNLANAEAMRDKLAASGFPTLMEIRVLAGPYPDRGAAQQAQRRLGELGVAPTLLVPARKASPGPESR